MFYTHYHINYFIIASYLFEIVAFPALAEYNAQKTQHRNRNTCQRITTGFHQRSKIHGTIIDYWRWYQSESQTEQGTENRQSTDFLLSGSEVHSRTIAVRQGISDPVGYQSAWRFRPWTTAFASPKPWAGYEPAAPIDLIGTDGAEYVNENALSVTIKHLRDKLGAQDYIKTIYGIGYNWIRKEKIKSLIADISHQTKTPITNLLLYVNFCWKKSFQHRQKQMWKHYTINQKNCDF